MIFFTCSRKHVKLRQAESWSALTGNIMLLVEAEVLKYQLPACHSGTQKEVRAAISWLQGEGRER